jgi:hypothetical protein
MIHHKIQNNRGKGEHYGVSYATPYTYKINGVDKKYNGGILLQVAEDEQSRICLTVEETQHIIELLQENIKLYQDSLKRAE